MINKLKICEIWGTNPYENLALEQYMLENLVPGEMILYLWQNAHTVVIGKNQNAWAECRVSLLEEEGGKLSRRLSGGGAVYHDLGNLNFTFITMDEDYDLDKQFSVIKEACALADISVEKSGRNDLLAEGRKFSGNAFYHHHGHSYHHGTLLITVDMEKLQKYLSPPKAKLEAKGVSSVRSRVVNLSELAPGLTCDTMRKLMRQAFSKVYGMEAEEYVIAEPEAVKALTEVNRSWDHLFGAPLPFTFECQKYFPWGFVQLQLQTEKGIIKAAKVYTDAMDWSLSEKTETALTGCKFKQADMLTALFKTLPNQQATDIAALLEENL